MAQAAIRQSAPERIVRPARRARRYKSSAASTAPTSSDDSTMGSASIALRAVRNAASSVNPCSTSCTTGRQVTMSSKSTTDSITSRDGLRKTSIHAEVSTSTTARLPVRRTILPDHAEIAFPRTAAGQFEDLPGAGAPHEILHRALARARVGPFAADFQRLFEQRRIKHKICAFHVYTVAHG